MAERLIVRSYRRVFRVDRRVYRVDRWALPVPGGVPLRGAGYFVATLVFVLVAGALPGVGDAVREITPPLRFVVIPLAVAMLGTQAAPDGRVAHRFARDWLAFRVRGRRARSAGHGRDREWRADGGALVTGLPLRHVHQNILVGHGDARAALYRVSTISYPFMAAADKREWLRRLARLAFAAEADLSLWRGEPAPPPPGDRGAAGGGGA